METDIQHYKIFQAMPEWLFDLTATASPGKCEFRSEELKALARRTDGLLVPEDDGADLLVAEFQFWNDPAIYNRLAEEMSIIQQNHGMRGIRGLVVFGDEELDPKTRPWADIVQAYYLPDLLAALRKRQPRHPLLAVFAPLMMNDAKRLEADAAQLYHNIQQSPLPDTVLRTLTDVFVSWLGQRFTGKTKKEIEAMLLGELPDVRETQLGKDLIEIGRKEGEKEGKKKGEKEGKKEGQLSKSRTILIRLLEDRFGKLDAATKRTIRKMASPRKLDALIIQAGKVQSLDDLPW